MALPMDARIRSERASVSVRPSAPFDANALLRRFSTPSPYTGLNSATDHSTVQLAAEPPTQEHGVEPSTKHNYILKSRGRDYATIVVESRSTNVMEPPILHFGDESLNGLVVLPHDHLNDMQSMEVVFQLFESDPIKPSYHITRTLSSQQVDESCISGGQFMWPFVIALPHVSSRPASSSTIRHLSPQGSPTGLRGQLIVTIYRRGRLTRNIGLTQLIYFVPPPEPVLTSSPSLLSTDLPSSNSGESPSVPANSSWPQQNYPRVVVRGVVFRRSQVDIECKLIVPVSHPVSDIIPLRLVMTCESREALDLLAVSHAIDVRLLKVMAFGDNAANIHPFTLRNRSSYHRTDWAARAQWEGNANSWELPPNDEHPRIRWRVKLNGQLHRDENVEISESYEQTGMALMYFVCLFPFRSTSFRPASDPNKELFMGKLPITRQR
ncbi:hypothetical protein EI94DRAFT_1827775 [Lactarius quietus]|nr:hypothetical protein EI94DRAFT_1827775 [Lactarius quietus]